MEAEATAGIATRGILSFQIGSIWLGARVEEAIGLLEADQIVPLPRRVSGLAGVVAFRGDMVPVLDLPAYLGGESTRATPRYVLTLGRGAERFGILVPDLPRLLYAREIREAELETSDPELGALIASVYQADGRSVHCLNYWHVFDSIIPLAAAPGANSRSRRGA